MFRTALCAAAVLMLSNSTPAPPKFLPMRDTLVPLNSPRGLDLLRSSKAQQPFWDLVQFYAGQPDLGSCSLGSCVMVLNALPIKRPPSSQHGQFELYTPTNIFTDEARAVLDREKARLPGKTAEEKVSKSGMTLDQLATVLKTFPVNVECIHASDTTEAAFRKRLIEALSKQHTYALLNYDRRALGQQSSGHISPVGAYTPEEGGMALVIDTANYKYPWTWVKIDELWKAMKTEDSESNRTRGFIIAAARGAR